MGSERAAGAGDGFVGQGRSKVSRAGARPVVIEVPHEWWTPKRARQADLSNSAGLTYPRAECNRLRL